MHTYRTYWRTPVQTPLQRPSQRPLFRHRYEFAVQHAGGISGASFLTFLFGFAEGYGAQVIDPTGAICIYITILYYNIYYRLYIKFNYISTLIVYLLYKIPPTMPKYFRNKSTYIYIYIYILILYVYIYIYMYIYIYI